ncbi:phosphoribosyltransferase family protein [Pseudoxanthobacter sp. M-2]|uniref:phosphoribosyltransferase n=1 Tax=Pseudoxanthobacter sp. M-2 TaxID=3078754 RepID=UPI0038FC4B3C
MPFLDRADAGRRLARALVHLLPDKPVVLALPRGGVPVAAELAQALHAPLDLVIARKIGTPMQPEVAMGAVVDGDAPIVLRNEDIIRYARVSEDEFRVIANAEIGEIERRRERYLAGRPSVDVHDRVVVLVDDGIATGATVRAAIRAVRRRHPARMILALPVGPTAVVEQLRRDVDELVCLEVHDRFTSVGGFFVDFRPTSDEEVLAALARCPADPDETAMPSTPPGDGATAPRVLTGH